MFAATKFSCLLSALCLAVTSWQASASAFLHTRTPGELHEVTRELIESTLRAELLMDAAHLEEFEKELRPMYIALPKNEQGTLDPLAVRYALHRYFVQKHGWYVKGLEPAGQAWNASAPTSVMKSRVPTYIQGLFEERLHGKGMGLHDLAVFAATLLDFVHNEALTDVMDLYAAFGMSTTSPAQSSEVDRVIKAYILQLLDLGNTIDSLEKMRDTERYMKEEFPGWDDFQMWVNDVRHTISLERSRRSLEVNKLSVGSVINEVQELNDRLGSFQDIECKALKAGLAEMEYKNTGRVLLSDFYHAGLSGQFLFNENTDFLRQLGALDESDPRHPSVIITNYLASQANCLAATSFHSICCIDECEGLMGHLEREIAAPMASPGHVAHVVAALRSDTVDAPRNLTATLMFRLQEIADHHGGLVPLHGRLFAQWMHHAYPLECPYPHAAGTSSPLSPDEWMEASGAVEVAAPAAEREQLAQQKAAHHKLVKASASLPWTAVEELVVPHKHPQASPKGPHVLRKLAAFAAVVAVAVPIARALTALFASSSEAKSEKCHLV